MTKRLRASNVFDRSSFKPHLNLHILFHLIGSGDLASSIYSYLEGCTPPQLTWLFHEIEWKMTFGFHHHLLPWSKINICTLNLVIHDYLPFFLYTHCLCTKNMPEHILDAIQKWTEVSKLKIQNFTGPSR